MDWGHCYYVECGGHLLPGFFMLLIGTLYTTTHLRKIAKGECYDCIERDPTVLKILGLGLTIVTGIGIFTEGIGGVIDPHVRDFFHQQFHLALYVSFTLPGLAALAELQFAPPDTHKYFIVLGLFNEAVLFKVHGSMQNGYEPAYHDILAAIAFAGAVAFAVAIIKPKAILAQLVGAGLFVLQFVWFTFIAYQWNMIFKDEAANLTLGYKAHGGYTPVHTAYILSLMFMLTIVSIYSFLLMYAHSKAPKQAKAHYRFTKLEEPKPEDALI